MRTKEGTVLYYTVVKSVRNDTRVDMRHLIEMQKCSRKGASNI